MVQTDLANLKGLLACSAGRLAAQLAGSLEHIKVVPASMSVYRIFRATRHGTYCPSFAKTSVMCSLSHSSSLRTEKPKSSSSCVTRSLDWWRSWRIHCADPMAGTLLRAAAMAMSG
jgi:hypothetical protein